MLPFLKNYIAGRANEATVLKTAIFEEITVTMVAGKKRTLRKAMISSGHPNTRLFLMKSKHRYWKLLAQARMINPSGI